MWPGIQVDLDFWRLFALFMRNFKEETWTHLMNSTVDVCLKLNLASWDSVWVNHAYSAVSLIQLRRTKGCLLWTVDDRTLKEFCPGFKKEMEENASGNVTLDANERWVNAFTIGVLHEVTGADVTGSKLKLTPAMHTNRNKPVAWYLDMPDDEFESTFRSTKPNATPASASQVENMPGARAGDHMDSWYN